MNRAIRTGAALFCLAATAAVVYNVYSDNGEVQRAAEKVACGGVGAATACYPQMTRMDRTPIAQTFEFATTKRAGPGSAASTSVTVTCARSAWLVGPYTCALP